MNIYPINGGSELTCINQNLHTIYQTLLQLQTKLLVQDYSSQLARLWGTHLLYVRLGIMATDPVTVAAIGAQLLTNVADIGDFFNEIYGVDPTQLLQLHITIFGDLLVAMQTGGDTFTPTQAFFANAADLGAFFNGVFWTVIFTQHFFNHARDEIANATAFLSGVVDDDISTLNTLLMDSYQMITDMMNMGKCMLPYYSGAKDSALARSEAKEPRRECAGALVSERPEPNSTSSTLSPKKVMKSFTAKCECYCENTCSCKCVKPKFKPTYKLIKKFDATNYINMSSIYTPLQIFNAYGFVNTPNAGAGITIAVVVAFSYPNLVSDVNTFCNQFGLPKPALDVRKMPNTTYDSSWAIEECIDVEMIVSFAPFAKIMVVEATSDSMQDLLVAVTYAVNNGANIVSMSFGTDEFSSEVNFEPIFSHPKVCYVAAGGDVGGVVNYPSSSANVMAVGGTTLTLGGTNQIAAETTWSSSGCGMSQFVSLPTFQTGIGTGTFRNCVDTAFVGNPNSGIFAFCVGSWYAVGGTSVSAPCWAAVLAICNQARLAAGKSLLTTVDKMPFNVLGYMYKNIYGTANYSLCFNDVTVGTAGKTPTKVGYDLPCGLGSPKVGALSGILAGLA